MATDIRLLYKADYSNDKISLNTDELVKNDRFLCLLSDDEQYQLARKLSICLGIARLGGGGVTLHVDEKEKTVLAEILVTNISLNKQEIIALSCFDWNAKTLQISNDSKNLIKINSVFML